MQFKKSCLVTSFWFTTISKWHHEKREKNLWFCLLGRIIFSPDLNNRLVIVSKDYFCALYWECIPAHKKTPSMLWKLSKNGLHIEHKIWRGNLWKGKECAKLLHTWAGQIYQGQAHSSPLSLSSENQIVQCILLWKMEPGEQDMT